MSDDVLITVGLLHFASAYQMRIVALDNTNQQFIPL
jgi:hypothetical protein